MTSKVVVLELNELSPTLLDRFIAAGKLPNFKRLRDESIVAVTDAEEQAPNLEPWIQWVTVHTGLPYSEHKCFHLNDGGAFKAPRLWDMVASEGGRVWVCGSMNAGIATDSIDGHVLPDPWATGIEPAPKELFDPYIRFVSAHVQEHSSGKPNLTKADVLRFGRFMIAHGLSAKTVWRIIRQLAGELREKTNWRRATILDSMQWDVFRSIYRSSKPDFATFFLNSTAHFQHFHWREMEPEAFAVKPTEEDLRIYGETILYGYQNMDKLVGEAMQLAGHDTSVVLCTALSQKPMLTHEDRGGRQIFRHHDAADLLAFAGVIEPYEYAPVMSQQFILHFPDEASAQNAEAKIGELRLPDGKQVMWTRRDGTQVLTGCMIEAWPTEGAMVHSRAANEQRSFASLFYPLEALRSGMHDPHGAFWVRTPSRAHVMLDRNVSLLEVAPTLATLAGIDASRYFTRGAIAEVVDALVPVRAAA